MAGGKPQQVLILGGGFAGVRAALNLGRAFRNDPSVQLTLIDRLGVHEYHACFYEVATAEQLDATARDLAVTSCVPLKEILRGLPVRVVRATVDEIQPRRRTVVTDRGRFRYDALIVGLGSTTHYWGIPGLAKHSLTLKTLDDAIRIRRRVEAVVRAATQRRAEIVIGGGGFSGCELAGELVNFIHRIARRYHGHTRNVRLTVVEACPQLLPGLPARVAEIVQQRLKGLRVHLRLNTLVRRVTMSYLTIQTDREKTSLPYDLLIWTGGIIAPPVVAKAGWKTNRRGQVLVKPSLSVPKYPGVFVVGDAAAIVDPATKQLVPAVASLAIDQGRQTAENVRRFLAREPLKAYQPYHKGFIIPVSGKFAIAELRHVRLVGFLGWLLRRFVDLKYYLGILPFTRAITLWWRGTVLYAKND